MKAHYRLAVAVFLFAGCMGNERRKIEAESIAIIEQYIHAVQFKDTYTMGKLLADDYVGYGPGVSDSINKEEAIMNWQFVAENLYEKIEYTRTVNIAASIYDGPHPGNYVADWARLKITYKGAENPVYLNISAVYRVENGKITLSRTFYDEADVYRQLGFECY